MAKRPVFITSTKEKGFVETVNIEFDWFPGFSIQQKQKSINSLHQNFKKKFSQNILEISSKSDNELGVSLSAFNLMIKTKNNREFSVETAFQSSKVFEKGGPFLDLLEGTSKEAKTDPRLKSSGNLTHFQYFSRKWGLEPKTLFYDWLYINAISLNEDLGEKILQYNAFSDIEFNPSKSINCQAKSAALYVALNNADLLGFVLKSTSNYIEVMGNLEEHNPELIKSENKELVQQEQLNMFDIDRL
jgi:hypothetical protein